jgi:hypothetical protein
MTGPGESASSTRDIRAALEQARVLLLEPTPRNIDLCCIPLTHAAARLKALPDRLVFRTEIETIGRLLETAATFHAGLFQKMNVAPESAGVAAVQAAASPRIRLSA